MKPVIQVRTARWTGTLGDLHHVRLARIMETGAGAILAVRGKVKVRNIVRVSSCHGGDKSIQQAWEQVGAKTTMRGVGSKSLER